MQADQGVKVHYVKSRQPQRIEEHFDDDDDSDLLLAQVLQDQEIVYRSFETRYTDYQLGSSSAAPKSTPHNVDNIRSLSKEKHKLVPENVELQLSNDHALAFALQEVENQASGPPVTEASTPESSGTGNTSGHKEKLSTASTSQVVIQDDIDPDNMTYEELQSLGEAIGTQCRGLPDELIAYLPTSKYKAGRFFKNNKHEECVICRMEYIKGDRLITLPCQHLYHADCGIRWLRVNKVCPICSAEVFGS